MRTILAVLFSFFITTAAFAADNFVWIEAENPTAKHGIKELTTWGHEYISGHWVNLSIDANKLDEIDGEAILLQYEFEGEPGTYELWNRVGLEYVRSPFDWRIDGGEWTTAQPDDLTIDLMEIGFWCEIAWLKLGDVTLTGGKHTLEIRLQKRTDAEGRPQRILYASDCICLYPGKFEPYSKYKPNEDHRTAKDMAAAEYVFDARTRFKPPGTQFSLAGTWEICRDDELLPEPVKQPISRLPNTTRWSAIEVPGDKNTLRPDLLFAHRVWYRTKVILPEGIAAGYIEFPQNNLNTTVYVNGVLCGFDKNPFARVRIDVSKGLKPGENEIMVGIRDAWYARTEMADDPMKLRRTFNYPKSFFENGFQDLVYPIWHHAQSGILVEPTLHLFGAPIYANDIFVKPSVANKEISVDVTLRNVSDADQTVKLFGQCWEPQLPGMPAVGKKFELKTVTIKANSEMVVTFNEKWENPKLWTPNEPNLYNFGCIVKGDFICGTGAGVKFGFREWSISGKHFMLNGVPYRAWADCFEQPTKEEWLQFYRDSNQTSMRFWGIKWQGMPPEEALNFWDENGVVVRRSGTFDGQRIGYNAIENDPRIREMNKAIDPAKEQIKLDLFANWRDQMVAQVKGERNHPSIMLWSLENEILYINCINLYGGLMDQFEDEIIRGAQMVKEVDPTRSSMVDGGGATKRGNPDGAIDPWLPGGLDGLEVHGDHYVVGDFTKYPCLAYEPNIHGGGRGRWIWDENRPRHIGEEFYVNGYLPADFAAIGGEEAFGGRTAARRSVGILLRMMTEGYRWNEYGGWQFWTNQHRAIDQYKSNAPIAVFCKEWDWTFAADVTVERTLRIFNDSMNGEHISFMVECESAGGMPRGAATGSPKEFFVPAGRHEEFTLAFSTSAFQPANRNDARTEGKLTFVLSVKDREVFRDTKDVSVLRVNHRSVAARSAPTQTPNGYTLLIYDP
ncbi:MAG: hypothetical protein FWE95_11630, partial [Planctomycetaceae bacterium]|nr:hypothetical protein [Planctomycetaceae bacterium]